VCESCHNRDSSGKRFSMVIESHPLFRGYDRAWFVRGVTTRVPLVSVEHDLLSFHGK